MEFGSTAVRSYIPTLPAAATTNCWQMLAGGFKAALVIAMTQNDHTSSDPASDGMPALN